jgi:glycosyltransferase involved in cell wall biosynthesis
MPFMKKDFKVGVTHLNKEEEGEGYFADSGIPLTGIQIESLRPDDGQEYMQPMSDCFDDDLPDAVIAALPDPAGAAFLIAAKAAGVPLVIAEVDDQPSLFSSFEELSAFYFSDLILPATRNLQRVLTQVFPELADRVGNLLPHSADTTYIQLTKEDRIRLRQELRVDTELKMITMIAPFDRRRDHDTILEACQLLKQRGLKFILMLVGDGPERRRVAEKVFALRLEDQVCIINDPGDHTDILCATDIFALSTHFEENSTTLIEAMAQGLSIAATRVPGIDDLIRDGRSGRLARPKDPESFAQALIDLLAQEKIRKKLGSVARKCIENRGNLTHFMPPLVQTIKRRLKEYAADPEGQHCEPNNATSGKKYLKLQQDVRNLKKSANPMKGISKAADLMDGLPVNVQVDIIERMCAIPLGSNSVAMLVRPLEKVLGENVYEHLPLLEMRLLERLSDFYKDLDYSEGVQKLIEKMEENVQVELFRYHFACNRFSGQRAHVRLAQLYEYVGHQDRRDFYRLELRDYLRACGGNGAASFHQQNARHLEILGEHKLAERELRKAAMGAIQFSSEVAEAYEEDAAVASKSGRKKAKIAVVAAGSGKSRRVGEKGRGQLQGA